ncbi:MAG TPA: hypothetical protein VLA39_03545 [Marinobacterium sp.]|nr:hypothetical protein [Marinobacterium sp.]
MSGKQSGNQPHPKFMDAMRKLSAMTEEERLSEENRDLFEQAIAYAPLDIQPQLIAIQKKYEHPLH